jgi:hypothetical protein
LATFSTPMVPPAPPAFSTMMTCPRDLPIDCADQARHGVGRAAGRERHDDREGAAGKLLRRGRQRESKRRAQRDNLLDHGKSSGMVCPAIIIVR